jgi:hypothetical protein
MAMQAKFPGNVFAAPEENYQSQISEATSAENISRT